MYKIKKKILEIFVSTEDNGALFNCPVDPSLVKSWTILGFDAPTLASRFVGIVRREH